MKKREEGIENKEKEERRMKINEFRHNCIKYKSIEMTEKLSKGLEGKKKWKDRSLIARYKCESETKGSSSIGERSKTGVAEYAW